MGIVWGLLFAWVCVFVPAPLEAQAAREAERQPDVRGEPAAPAPSAPVASLRVEALPRSTPGPRIAPPAPDVFAWDTGTRRYPRVSLAEWIVGGTTLAVATAIQFWWRPSTPHWTGPILFDEGVRDVLLIRNDRARKTATAISDVNFYAMLTLPTLIDVGLVTAWAQDKPEVAGQMVGMNLLSHGIAGLMAYSVTALVARQRPFAGPCMDDRNYDPACGDPGSVNASFFSGHAAAAAAGAGVTCVHHEYLPLYGGGIGDTLACAVGVTMAASVGLLRIMTDNHYATDILVGSGLGFGLGYGLPYFLHYRHGRLPANLAVAPLIERGGYGLQVVWE